MKRPLELLLLVLAIIWALVSCAHAERLVDLAWDVQAEATSFRVYADGKPIATATTNSVRMVIPEGKTTLTVTATSEGGESLPSVPLIIPASPKVPTGFKVVQIIRTTISKP